MLWNTLFECDECLEFKIDKQITELNEKKMADNNFQFKTTSLEHTNGS